jgi:hypothetical protein
MTKRKKIIFSTLGALAVIFAVAYYFLLAEKHVPENCSYQVDVGELRTLASSIPGDKATSIHVERIAEFKMPGAVVIAGHPWSTETMSTPISWSSRRRRRSSSTPPSTENRRKR